MKTLVMILITVTAVSKAAAGDAGPISSPAKQQATVLLQCPDSITVAMVGVPSGWAPFIFPGAQVQKFNGANAEQEGATMVVACYYDNARSVGAPYVLTRRLPGQYQCTVLYNAVRCNPRLRRS